MTLTREAALTVLKRYRGAFALTITRNGRRRTKTNPNGLGTEALSGTTDRDDVYDEAISLLTDPRDTVIGVTVWSDRYHCALLHFDRDDVVV